MAAALAATENENVQVILMERQARVGRKLAATGNGRCNLTNLHANGAAYHGDDAAFASYALQRFPVADTLNWFRTMGLYTVAEDSGRVYPYSDQANSVVDVLRFALEKPNIQLLTGFEVKKVKSSGAGFHVESAEEDVFCDKLIVACGGCASLKGVRANCRVQILHDEKLHLESRGELQFTDYGLSGPVIFEVSRDTCQGRGNWTAKLDFLPEMEFEVLRAELNRRKETNWNAEELLTGILHNRLGRVLTQSVGIKDKWKIADLRDDEMEAVCHAVKSFEAQLSETMGMDAAQVTAGGIVTSEFNPQTMESLRIPNLYACGEVLDIDGDCGGYNLQWAWSSGRLAGTSAGGNT